MESWDAASFLSEIEAILDGIAEQRRNEQGDLGEVSEPGELLDPAYQPGTVEGFRHTQEWIAAAVKKNRIERNKVKQGGCDEDAQTTTSQASKPLENILDKKIALWLDDRRAIQIIQRRIEFEEERQERLARLQSAVRTILECVGDHPDRKGLAETAERHAKALLLSTKGYENSLHNIVNNATFEAEQNKMVVVKDVKYSSICELSLVAFSGKVHVAYMPNNRVIDDSKVAEIVAMYWMRLQDQERLTMQINLNLKLALDPQGVAVIVEAAKYRRGSRGEMKEATTMTYGGEGVFTTNAETKKRFWELVGW